MTPVTPSSPAVRPEELLAYAEGSVSAADRTRLQAAICADRYLLEQVRSLRRHFAQEAVIEPWPEELAASAPLPWEDAWKRLQEWCVGIRANLVVAAEALGNDLRALTDSAWLPMPQSARLRSPSQGAATSAPAAIHLQRGNHSIQLRVTGAGAEITVVLDRPLGGRVELKQPPRVPGGPTERLPGTQVAHLQAGRASLELPLPPGIHPLLVEITPEGQEPLRWACLLQRPG